MQGMTDQQRSVLGPEAVQLAGRASMYGSLSPWDVKLALAEMADLVLEARRERDEAREAVLVLAQELGACLCGSEVGMECTPDNAPDCLACKREDEATTECWREQAYAEAQRRLEEQA